MFHMERRSRNVLIVIIIIITIIITIIIIIMMMMMMMIEFLEHLFMWDMLNCTEQVQKQKYKMHAYRTHDINGFENVSFSLLTTCKGWPREAYDVNNVDNNVVFSYVENNRNNNDDDTINAM